jgi:hypothetical protein
MARPDFVHGYLNFVVAFEKGMTSLMALDSLIFYFSFAVLGMLWVMEMLGML